MQDYLECVYFSQEKITNLLFVKYCKIVTCESAVEKVSIEWSHYMISSRDLEVRTSYSKINITTGKFCSEANGVFKYEVYTPSWAE